jgi:hypothetical protein
VSMYLQHQPSRLADSSAGRPSRLLDGATFIGPFRIRQRRRGPVARIRPAKLVVQIDQVRVNQAHLLAQLRECGGMLLPLGGLHPVELGSKLLDLFRKVIDGRRLSCDSFGRGTDVDALAWLAEQQSVRAKLGYRCSNHRAGDAVGLGQLCSRRNRRADRELRRGDLPSKIASDLLVGGAPDRFGHLVVLLDPRPAVRLARHVRLAESLRVHNHMYYVEHSVLACPGQLRTATDKEPADATAITPQKDTTQTRFTVHRSSPGEHAAKHTRRGCTPNQEAPPSWP